MHRQAEGGGQRDGVFVRGLNDDIGDVGGRVGGGFQDQFAVRLSGGNGCERGRHFGGQIPRFQFDLFGGVRFALNMDRDFYCCAGGQGQNGLR